MSRNSRWHKWGKCDGPRSCASDGSHADAWGAVTSAGLEWSDEDGYAAFFTWLGLRETGDHRIFPDGEEEFVLARPWSFYQRQGRGVAPADLRKEAFVWALRHKRLTIVIGVNKKTRKKKNYWTAWLRTEALFLMKSPTRNDSHCFVLFCYSASS